MYFDSKAEIAGFSTKKIRDFIRKVQHYHYIDLSDVMTKLNVEKKPKAKKVLNELVKAGFLELTPETDEFCNKAHLPTYGVTAYGCSLARANFSPRISRKKADEIYQAFMQRVAEVNSNDYYLVRVKSVILFGSYLTDSEELGDVDIFLDLENKDIPDIHERLEERCRELHQTTTRGDGNFLAYLYLPTSEVHLFLKSKSKYLHLSSSSDGVFDLIPATEKRVVYLSKSK